MSSSSTTLVGLAAVLLAGTGSWIQAVDLDDDGQDDFWELQYGVSGLDPEADDDGDGWTNAAESLAGTDPRDAHSRLYGVGSWREAQSLVFRWSSVPDQAYRIETSRDLLTWEPVAEDDLVAAGSDAEAAIAMEGEALFLRVRPVGRDSDRDGISDRAELALGWNPMRASSSGVAGPGDAARAVALLQSGDPFAYAGGMVGGTRPERDHIARFMMQATLGPTPEQLAYAAEIGIEAWIDEQVALDPGYVMPEIRDRRADGLDTFANHANAAWFRQVLGSPDLLRQRVAFALSQIFVVSANVIGSPEGLASHYDLLLEHAFGNWRDLVLELSNHPSMGQYLNHMSNRKADPEVGRFPDENFARELMQLFSIGLFELNDDGSEILDGDGRPIPTYTQEDIRQLARVFTGQAFGGPLNDVHVDWHFFWGERDYEHPMKIWTEHHDVGEKVLLGGEVVLPAFAEDPGRTAADDITDAVDLLFHHPNTGPFLARRLIQRLVTSNPSPGYIRRVAQVFADNGSGERGDLGAVVKAILLDPEARGEHWKTDPAFGHLREPLLRAMQPVLVWARRDDLHANNEYHWNADSVLGQKWMESPSVFNFFLPDYQPHGPLRDEDLVAPEFQVLNSTTALSTPNRLLAHAFWGYGQVWNNWDAYDHTAEYAIWEDSAALLDHLDAILTYGRLSDETRTTILQAMEAMPEWYRPYETVMETIYLILISPDAAVMR